MIDFSVERRRAARELDAMRVDARDRFRASIALAESAADNLIARCRDTAAAEATLTWLGLLGED